MFIYTRARARSNIKTKSIVLLLKILYTFRRHRDYRTGLDKPCVLSYGIMECPDGTSPDHFAVSHIIPVISGREPHCSLSKAGFLVRRTAYSSGKDIVTEHILLLPCVGIVILRIIIIHRTAHGNSCIICLTGSIVDVRRKGITEFKGILHISIVLREHPESSLNDVGACAMSLEQWREHSVLKPSCIKLGIRKVLRPLHMASQVMAPVSIADI